MLKKKIQKFKMLKKIFLVLVYMLLYSHWIKKLSLVFFHFEFFFILKGQRGEFGKILERIRLFTCILRFV